MAGGGTLVYGVILYLAALQAQGVSLREVFRISGGNEKKTQG